MNKIKTGVLVLIVTLLITGVFTTSFGYREVDGKKYLIWGARQPVTVLDPSVYYDWSTRTLQQAVYDGLLKYVGKEIKPWLAKSYEANKNADVWTFNLVKNAKFHNGDPVTAEAVKYSYTRTLELNQGPAWTFAEYLEPDGIEVVDKYTVKFHLKKPFAPFASYVPWWYIMNPNQVEAHVQNDDYGQEWLKENEAGSGPFEINRWETGEFYWLNAVEDYWKGWPHEDHINGFIFRLVREPASQKLGIMQGELDIVAGVSSDDFDVLADNPEIYVSEHPGATTFGAKMNTQKGYTANRLIRTAMCYAMDYQSLLDIYGGHAILEDSPFTPATKGYVSLKEWAYRQDLDRAKEYMKMAGYPDGGFTLEYVYVAGFAEEESIGLVIKDSLSKIGINVKMIPLPWPQMVERGSKVETSPDMMAVFTTPLTLDPDAVAFQYHPDSWGKYYGTEYYDNPRTAKLIKEARVTADWEDRAKLYDEIQRLIYFDAPEIFGMIYNKRWAFRDWVKGFVYSPVRMTNEIDMYTFYIED